MSEGAPGGGVSAPGLGLPSVVHEASAAVLVVDLREQLVTYHNDLARELAPLAELPVTVDDWSAAAGLEDVVGADLPAGSRASSARAESLLRIAQGEPVTGEAVTAARATSVTQAREILWVTGLPLTDAPEPMSNLALVVFVPARNAQQLAGVQQSATRMRDRALVATKISFTITDPHLEDNPLVWVNPAFTATTGYELSEVVGRNCRFLQGDGTDRNVVAQIKRGIAAELPVTATLLNYTRDGVPFWNELSISPVRDNAGAVTHFVGVQADVTTRIEAQQARDAALAQVNDAADRLALLSSFSARMATTRQPRQIVQMLTRVLVPRVATWAAVYTIDSTGRPEPPHVLHEDGRADEAQRLGDALRSGGPQQLTPIARVLTGEEPEFLLADLDGDDAISEQTRGMLRDLGARSLAVVPLRSRAGILGAVAVASDARRPRLTSTDVTLLTDLSVRAGLMLENAQLYALERATAETLQRSLLPRLPEVPGLEVAATYVPAADAAAVGGDWYDVFALRGETPAVGVVVGDVMGHNIDSAARMGKLSTVVRAYGWPGSDPFTVLTAVDELIAGTNLDVLATCFYSTLTLHVHGATLRYSSAGHPPAVVRRPEGSAVTLDQARGPMLGVTDLLADATRPHDAAIDLSAGSTLICFTDGLVDAFGREDLATSVARLTEFVGELPPDASPRTVVDTLTQETAAGADDVAVVALRILEPASGTLRS